MWLGLREVGSKEGRPASEPGMKRAWSERGWGQGGEARVWAGYELGLVREG